MMMYIVVVAIVLLISISISIAVAIALSGKDVETTEPVYEQEYQEQEPVYEQEYQYQEQEPVYQEPTISPYEGYTKHANKDIGGNDIGCFTDGSSAEFCKVKCDEDQECTSYNYIHPDGPWSEVGAGSGCCYKKAGGVMNDVQKIDFYTKN
jgi:hypothetical protein